MPRILVAGKIHDRGLSLLRSAPDVTLDYVEDTSPQAYRPHLAAADAVLLRTQPMTADIIDMAERLKIVSRHGVGFDTVDMAALSRRGIPLAVVGDVSSTAVAEQTAALMLACAKRLIRHDAAARSGNWNLRDELEASELEGKVLLIVGFGRIGRKMAGFAAAFGMRLLAYDPYQDRAAVEAAGAQTVDDLADGLAEADFVSIHIPKTKPEPIIGAAELARMKPTAVILSTARGGLIDEQALAAAFASNRLAGAGLDVLASEPPPADHPLLASDRVIVTPHIGGLTRESAERLGVGAARNILDFFAGDLHPSLVVNGHEIGFAIASRSRP